MVEELNNEEVIFLLTSFNSEYLMYVIEKLTVRA